MAAAPGPSAFEKRERAEESMWFRQASGAQGMHLAARSTHGVWKPSGCCELGTC